MHFSYIFLSLCDFCIIFAIVKHLFIYIALSLCSIACYAQQSVKAKQHFQVMVKCGRNEISMTFRHHPKHKRYVVVGEGKYGSPAIDVATVGRLVVPDSVSDASGQRYLVRAVGRQAFAHCSRLTEVILPDSVSEIGDQAFVGCTRLREVTLPKALRVIYPFAFRDCTHLNVVRLNAVNRPAVYDNIFDQQTLNRATLIIPAGTSTQYGNSLVWGMFRYTIEDFDY